MENYRIIRKELERHSPTLAEKPEIIVLSKLDLVPPEEQSKRISGLKKRFKGHEVFAISAPMMDGVEVLQDTLIEKIPAGQRELQEPEISDEDESGVKVYDLTSYRNPRTIRVRRVDRNTFEVSGDRIEEIARMTNMQNREAIARMHDILEREHVVSKIRAMLEVDAEALRESYFEGAEDIDYNPKIVISGRVFNLGDIHFRSPR